MPSMPFIAYCLEGQEEESTLLHASVASSCENIAVYTSNEMDVAAAVHLKVPGQKLLLLWNIWLNCWLDHRWDGHILRSTLYSVTNGNGFGH